MTSFPFITNKPNPTNPGADDQPDLLTNNMSIPDWWDVDHVGFNEAGGGTHERVTFSQTIDPTYPVLPPQLGTFLVGKLPQLFWLSGTEQQSKKQYRQINNTPKTKEAGSTFAFGSIIVKYGSYKLSISEAQKNNPTFSSTISFTDAGSVFPNNCFNVQLLLYRENAIAAPFPFNPRAIVTVLSKTKDGFTYFYRRNTTGKNAVFNGFTWWAIGN